MTQQRQLELNTIISSIIAILRTTKDLDAVLARAHAGLKHRTGARDAPLTSP